MSRGAPIVRLASETSARGLLVKAPETGKSVAAFLGIPYAVPPIKSLRFKPTKSIELWKGMRECTSYGLSLLLCFKQK